LSGLTVLAPYQTIVRVLAILLLGTAFWLAFGRSGADDKGTVCKSAHAGRVTKSALWLGALVMALVLSATWWQQFVV
jgi:putative copper export protein